jgi:signal transduction histidine kinase
MSYLITQTNLQLYRIYILMIIIIFPLWSFANQYFIAATNGYMDTYLMRLSFVTPGILFYFLSFKSDFFKRNIHWLFLIVCICLIMGHGYLASLSRFNYILVSGQILVMLLVSVHLDSIKHFLIFNTIALFVTLYPVEGIPAVPRILYFLELLTVSLVTFVVLIQKLKLVKQIEESQKLLEKERLRSFNSQKRSSLGKMAAGVAHEINNPLAILILYSNKMMKMGGKTEELIDLDKKHNKTVKRISKIVKGLISLSRDGSKDPHTEIEAHRFIQEVKDIYLVKLKNDGVILEINIPKDLKVYGRITELQQVFLGLVNNAYDAISLQKIKIINVNFIQMKQDIELTIQDNGIGVKAEIIDEIFDPFYSTKKTGEGMGLDLSISKGIIEDHGGNIFVDPENLSTFVVRIPSKT